MAPLIDALADRDEQVRHDAAYAFRGIGPIGHDAVLPLAKIVTNKDEDLDTRRNAIRALGVIGAAAKEAIPALLDSLKDPDNDNNIRRDVIGTLGDIGPGAKAAVPALLNKLKRDTHWERRGVIEALGQIGPEAEAAVPALLEELKGGDRLKAALALACISPRHKAQAVAELRKLLKHDAVYTWTEAASALLRLSPPDKEEATALLRLGLKEETTRFWAACALRDNGAEAKALVPDLIALWKDEQQEENVWRAVAGALKRIDPAAAKRAGVP